MKQMLLITLAILAIAAAPRVEHFHYYLDRGDASSARGYQAFVITFSPGGTPQYAHVRIDEELRKRPRDRELLELQKRAVAALSRCVLTHTKGQHVIKADGGSNRPIAYHVFCDPERKGCGNSYTTCDSSGSSLPSPCPVIEPTAAAPPARSSFRVHKLN